jgi:hypothetical protein
MANAAQDVFLWQGALLEPFAGLSDRSLPGRSQLSVVFSSLAVLAAND